MPLSKDALLNIYDKQMSIYTDYLVYFDDVCMNDFVLEYQVNIGVQIGLGSATVSLLYAPSFGKGDAAESANDGIENGTAVRIFANNMFSRKYDQVFDGILKQRIFNRSASGWSISFTAVDHFYWMQRIIAPISIPFSSAVSPGERLKWKAQSIDPQKVATIETVKAGSLKGKTVTEFFDLIKQASFENSRVYSEQNTVANFDAAIDRVEIMGDIDEDLKSKEVIDFVIDSNSVFTDTAYVALNNAASTLLMELYQDRDGIIRVKPPYWNEPVLRSHVIDPLMIISASEQTNWNNFYTRVITTGGLEEWQNTGNTTSKTDFLTPVGAYVGCFEDKSKAGWADYLSEGTAVSSFDEDFLSKHNKMKKGSGGDDSGDGGPTGGGTITNQSVIDYLNTTGGSDPKEWGIGSGTQCVELPKHYVETCFGVRTKESGYGNGKDLYSGLANAFPDILEAITWSSNTELRPGDIMSTSSRLPINPNKPHYGHALIVKAVDGGAVELLDQWDGIKGGVRCKTWNISGNTIKLESGETRTIYGIARPKNI